MNNENKSCSAINEELYQLHKMPLDGLKGKIEGIIVSRTKLLEYMKKYIVNNVNNIFVADMHKLLEDLTKEINLTQKVLSEKQHDLMLKNKLEDLKNYENEKGYIKKT